ncbi:MAG: ABC transporter permease [Oscillospiraceae bacterium]|nr:ABC transporter permease [Oscillospiraceae bacterium]
MVNYIIRRVLLALLIILLVSFAVFVLVRQLPGDPIEMVLSQNMLIEMTPEMIAEARAARGLDRPVVVQFIYWLGNLLRGDFGISILHNYNIGDELGNRVVVSLLIGVPAFIIAMTVGPFLGLSLQSEEEKQLIL